MASYVQMAFNGKMPPRPTKVKDRPWEWLRRHVENGESYVAIAADAGVTPTYVQVQCTRAAQLSMRDKVPRHYETLEDWKDRVLAVREAESDGR